MPDSIRIADAEVPAEPLAARVVLEQRMRGWQRASRKRAAHENAGRRLRAIERRAWPWARMRVALRAVYHEASAEYWDERCQQDQADFASGDVLRDALDAARPEPAEREE